MFDACYRPSHIKILKKKIPFIYCLYILCVYKFFSFIKNNSIHRYSFCTNTDFEQQQRKKCIQIIINKLQRKKNFCFVIYNGRSSNVSSSSNHRKQYQNYVHTRVLSCFVHNNSLAFFFSSSSSLHHIAVGSVCMKGKNRAG